jgi:hypothetical protein
VNRLAVDVHHRTASSIEVVEAASKTRELFVDKPSFEPLHGAEVFIRLRKAHLG